MHTEWRYEEYGQTVNEQEQQYPHPRQLIPHTLSSSPSLKWLQKGHRYIPPPSQNLSLDQGESTASRDVADRLATQPCRRSVARKEKILSGDTFKQDDESPWKVFCLPRITKNLQRIPRQSRGREEKRQVNTGGNTAF